MLEPHRLIIMHTYIISAVFDEDVHCCNAPLGLSVFQEVQRCDRIDSSISFVKDSGLFVQYSCFLTITTALVDLSLEGVQVKHGGCVGNCFVNELKSGVHFSLEKIVL